MSTTILTTKLYVPPPRPGWVSRPRLVQRLDEGLDRRLTLISAPAGFGKTTLITSWLHGTGERLSVRPSVAWLSLEQGDNVPARFLDYVIAAFQTIGEGIAETAKSLLEAAQPPPLNHLMTLLINDLVGLTGPTVLVLDDFHVIDHPDIHRAMTFLLDHLPPRAHVIIATREEPSLPLARLRVQGQATEIRLHDLRFTREEAAAFLNQTMGLTLSAEAIDTLESRTEGWVAGLQMAALSLRGPSTPLRAGRSTALTASPTAPGTSMALGADDFGCGQHFIIEYLGAEVLRQQPAAIRAFLRQTSILDRLCAPLCDAVTGQANSRSYLKQVEQANLFLIPVDDQHQWYRYHSLFADFLRNELAEWEQTPLHTRASAWYEAHGFMPEAIRHALAAHDLAAAERLICSDVEPTLSRGGFTTLLTWLNALPDEVVRARSDLSAYKAWILYLRGEIVQAEEYAAAAAEAQRPDDPPALRGMFLAFRAYLELSRGDPHHAVELGRETLALLGGTKSFFRTTALYHLGQAQRLTGDRQAAIQTLREAVTLGQQLGHPVITLEALGYVTLLLFQQGQLREAIALCHDALGRYTDERGQPLPMAGLVLIPLGTLYLETNDLEQAERCLTTGLELCEQMGTVYYTLVGRRSLAKVQYVRGDLDAVWETLAAARRLASQSESPRRVRMVNAVTAEVQLRQGHIAAAARTLTEVQRSREARSVYENLTLVRLRLAEGEPCAAHELLDELEHSARAQGCHGTLVTVHVLQVLTEKALHRHAAAVARMDDALALAAGSGYRRPFLDEGSGIADVLRERRHVAPDFVDSLLSALPSARANEPDARPSSAAAANKVLTEPLGDTQLTILRLVADGLSNQEVADKLGITVGTTKWHLSEIYGKLGVASRTQALAHARRLRLI
jgi:LuxR family transcriptional regulator, maltose regulon positive regulatory protein